MILQMNTAILQMYPHGRPIWPDVAQGKGFETKQLTRQKVGVVD